MKAVDLLVFLSNSYQESKRAYDHTDHMFSVKTKMLLLKKNKKKDKLTQYVWGFLVCY